jgi:hypothetical protein
MPVVTISKCATLCRMDEGTFKVEPGLPALFTGCLALMLWLILVI